MVKEIKLDLGNVTVHKHVIEDIVAKSMESITGASLVEPKFSDRIKSFLFGPSRPGISIRVDNDQELVLDVAVTVAHGSHIPFIGRQIQEVIKQDIQKALDIGIKDVNVDIEALKRG
jgi:uncharacterized alkaline shock family protein YloU